MWSLIMLDRTELLSNYPAHALCKSLSARIISADSYQLNSASSLIGFLHPFFLV